MLSALRKSDPVPIPPLPAGMEGRAPAVPHLPDELVVEILARLPAKSLCRFKCVSQSWRRLICDPAHRGKLAQTLSGFFVFPCHLGADECLPSHFVGLSADGRNDGPPPPLVDTALSFLPPICGQMEFFDSCNGLLLLLCWGTPSLPVHPFYVVCNPATREWLELPQPSEVPGQDGDVLEMGENKRTRNAVLGFDPAISLNFHVFQLLETECQTDYKIEAVEIYSSEAGRWILSKCDWGEGGFHIFDRSMTYLNSALHFTVQSGAVAAVDTKGEAWRVNRVLPKFHECYGEGFILHSQGRLLYMFDDHRGDSLSVYVLEDRCSEEWTFKHNISKADLFGQRKQPWWPYYDVVAFHPDANLIFIYDRQRNILISYCMTHMDVHVISTIGGEKCSICTSLGTECTYHRILPYIPQYSRTLVIPIVN